MNNRTLSFIVLALCIVVLAGCSTRIGDFTLISTKNVEIGGKFKKVDRYTAEDSKAMILSIPLGIPSLKTAVDRCIEQGKGYFLTDAVLESSFWWVILFGEQKYTVIGDVWTKADMSDLVDPNIELYELRVGAAGYQLVSVNDPQKCVKVDYMVSN